MIKTSNQFQKLFKIFQSPVYSSVNKQQGECKTDVSTSPISVFCASQFFTSDYLKTDRNSVNDRLNSKLTLVCEALRCGKDSFGNCVSFAWAQVEYFTMGTIFVQTNVVTLSFSYLTSFRYHFTLLTSVTSF